MNALRPTLLAAAVLGAGLIASPAAEAGQLLLRYVDPDHYADAGADAAERLRVQQALQAHLARLAGALLPAGQTLRIEVLDLDLAGQPHTGRRGDLRVLRGGADAPRVTLRYQLLDGERPLAQGEERLTDLDYLSSVPTGSVNRSEALVYEKRLLERWLRTRFDAAH